MQHYKKVLPYFALSIALLVLMGWFYNDLQARVAVGNDLADGNPPYRIIIFPILALFFIGSVCKMSLTASAIDRQLESKTFGKYWLTSMALIGAAYFIFTRFL